MKFSIKCTQSKVFLFHLWLQQIAVQKISYLCLPLSHGLEASYELLHIKQVSSLIWILQKSTVQSAILLVGVLVYTFKSRRIKIALVNSLH